MTSRRAIIAVATNGVVTVSKQAFNGDGIDRGAYAMMIMIQCPMMTSINNPLMPA